MMGRTHALCGLASLWILEPSGALTVGTLVPALAAALFGALLPDLDAGESLLKRVSVAGIAPFAPVAVALNGALGHRGPLHSVLGLALASSSVGLPLGLWLGWTPCAALALGYASHLAADAMTKSGIPFFYPRRRRCHLLPKGWRITTGSLAEEALLPLFAAAVLSLLFSHLNP